MATETQTAPEKPPSIEVRIPPGVTHTDSDGALYTVVHTADIDPLSLKIARAFAYGVPKGLILVVGNNGEVETFSEQDFKFSGLVGTPDSHKGSTGTKPTFGSWD